MIKVLTVVALLAVAQIIPSCGGGSPSSDTSSSGKPAVVIGWVDEKFTRVRTETLPYIIVINHLEYGVPREFYLEVKVGDLVKFDGEIWTIVRKAKP